MPIVGGALDRIMKNNSLWAAIGLFAVALLRIPAAHAAWTLNLTPGIDDVSRHIYSLHMLMFWWCVGIAVAVFAFIVYSMVRFRQSRNPVPDVSLRHNTRVEIIWTLLPALIL